jgi:glucose-1-phosphate adenylyltransferase
MTERDTFSALFASEPASNATPLVADPPWKVMLVDDEEDIHAVLRLALADVRVDARTLQLLEAKSSEEAKTRLVEHPDTALILLDVVMETKNAGLDLVRYIREELGNHKTQIVLVTGQPGYVTQREVITSYAINGYHLKSELSADKIFSSVYSALRSHQALVALELRQQQLSNILWGSGIGTWEWNMHTGEARFNERWAEMIGYCLEELAPLSIDTWMRLLHPDDLETFKHRRPSYFSDESGYYECEARVLHKDGHWVWVLDRGKVVSRTPDGLPQWISGTRDDITLRKLAEEALAASEERFRTVADYTLDWEYWEGPQHEMLYMSPSCESITGYSRDKFFADPSLLTHITHPDDVALLRHHHLEIGNDEDGSLEYRIVHRDGSVRWMEHGCHPVHSASGQFRGRRVSNRDVTERKKTEARANELLHVAQKTYGLILAGGRGTRLYQLTAGRSKPAVPFGGKLRIIDFPLSNCVNSGIRRVGVLTQYKAQSLIRHIERGWGFMEPSLNEYIDVVPAQQQINAGWYSGTADAVYQNLSLLVEADPSYVLILAGDHIYKMDYTRILADHVNSAADLTVACIELPIADVSGFGVMAVDDSARVTAFEEKPTHPTPIPGNPGYALASMGIYVFNADFLREQLSQDAANSQSSHDFGRDLIPRLIHSHHVQAHRFTDSCVNMIQGRPYWRDVGTVDAYWEANMDLTHVVPDLNLYDDDWPILSVNERSAPAKFVLRDSDLSGIALDSLVSNGCIVSGARVYGSVLFTKVRVAEYSLIEDSVLLPDVVVGRHVILRRAVVDNSCIIPDGFQVGVNPDADRARFHVTDRGITLITPEMLSQSTHRVL